MQQHAATFANFICRFGGERVLLDYAEEIVIPAFTDDTLLRSYGKTQFFFHEVSLVTLDKNTDPKTVGIAGRFVKNTVLNREQVFDPTRGIIPDEAYLASAPSAFFVLVLNNHRLIYFPETAHAPDLSMFAATSKKFLRKKHADYVNQQYVEINETSNSRVTKAELQSVHVAPTLDVVPMSGGDAVTDFVQRFGLLKRIEFKVLRPNDEIQHGANLFEDIRDYVNPLKPDDTHLVAKRSEGFDVEEAAVRIEEVVSTGNQEVKLTGKDHDGNELRGDNNEFKINTPVGTVPATKAGLVKRLYGILEGLNKAGTLKIPQPSREAKEKLRKVIGLF